MNEIDLNFNKSIFVLFLSIENFRNIGLCNEGDGLVAMSVLSLFLTVLILVNTQAPIVHTGYFRSY